MSSLRSPGNAVTVQQILARKPGGAKITMLTAYDFPTARLLDQVDGLDIVLVGDSLGNVELGYDSTVPVTMDDMVHHASAVRRGVSRALVVADMPFLSHQISEAEALRNAGRLVQEGGANAVKLEGGVASEATIRRIVDAGIPVMGHIGLTPQSVNAIGLRVQGRGEEGARRVMADALAVQRAGAFAVVLELVPLGLAQQITEALAIPTIGIGSGPQCDGQVLVIADLLGLSGESTGMRHVRAYADLASTIKGAVTRYCEDVAGGEFPTNAEAFR